jgi:hypothetical protein
MGLVLLLAGAILAASALLRSAEYDEGYTLFVTGAEVRPDWPATPFTRQDVAASFTGGIVGPGEIAQRLRITDVHPPLYFWTAALWRDHVLDGLTGLRLLNAGLALAAIAAWMGAAWRFGLPPVAVGLLTALAYGFVSTGSVARGFALSHMMLALSVLAAALTRPQARLDPPAASSPWAAAIAGMAAGLACLSNHLALFPAAAVLAWLVLAPCDGGLRQRARLALAAGLPFLLLFAVVLDYALAQKDSRPDQFAPFETLRAVHLLVQYNAASLLGGHPLYVEGAARLLLGLGLLGLLGLGAGLVAWHWRALGSARWLLLGGFLLPSAGPLALGVAFGNTPIELRYLAFAVPFGACLLAGALAAAPPRLAGGALAVLLLVQALGVAGMLTAQTTMQTQRHALAAVAPQLGPGSVLAVPFGFDGVGLVGAALHEAPADQRILVLRDGDAAALPARASGHARLVLLAITEAAGQRQVDAARAALAASAEWQVAGTLWSDARRGFSAELYLRR